MNSTSQDPNARNDSPDAAVRSAGASRNVRGGALALYTTLILALALTPNPPDTSAFPSSLDKLVHFGMFAGFAGLAHWWVWPNRGIGWITAASLGLAGFIELAQIPIPNRGAEVLDWVAGAIGSVGASVVLRVIVDRRPRDRTV